MCTVSQKDVAVDLPPHRQAVTAKRAAKMPKQQWPDFMVSSISNLRDLR